jgi:hypothetical protein
MDITEILGCLMLVIFVIAVFRADKNEHVFDEKQKRKVIRIRLRNRTYDGGR